MSSTFSIRADYEALQRRYEALEFYLPKYTSKLAAAIKDRDERETFRDLALPLVQSGDDPPEIFDLWYGFHYREAISAPAGFDSDVKSLRKRFAHLEDDPEEWVLALAYNILTPSLRRDFLEYAENALAQSVSLEDIFQEWRESYAYFPSFFFEGQWYRSGEPTYRDETTTRLSVQRAAGTEKQAKAECGNFQHFLLPAFGRLDLQDLCYSTGVLEDISIGREEADVIEVPPEGILAQGNWENCTAPVVLIRIMVPGHIMIAAYIRKTHRLEYFDASGSRNVEFRGKVVAQVITLLEGLKHVPKVIVVNTRHIQRLERFGYCQTWILWYAYMRFARSNPWTAKQISRYLQESTLEDLGDDIRNFYNALVSL